MMSPQQSQQLAEQRQAALRALRTGRQWILRSVLLVVVAVVAFTRGGAVYLFIGATMLLLAAMAASLGRTIRLQARRMEEKIDLMEHMSSEELGELSG
jgi:hypothetical protein